jgi:hypothetical protein
MIFFAQRLPLTVPMADASLPYSSPRPRATRARAYGLPNSKPNQEKAQFFPTMGTYVFIHLYLIPNQAEKKPTTVMLYPFASCAAKRRKAPAVEARRVGRPRA